MSELEVVAAALVDDRGRILITERPAGKSSAGRWEFPGGKREPGESHQDALCRELLEELGIKVASEHCVPLMQLRHEQAERVIHLYFFEVRSWRGELKAREAQRWQWLLPAQLSDYDILEADQPFIQLLQRRGGALDAGKVFTEGTRVMGVKGDEYQG